MYFPFFFLFFAISDPIGIVSNESGGSNESGTGDNRAATSVHRACRDSARRWRRHRLRRGALALLEPGFAFCILHAAERRHSASRYPRAPGVSPTQSWGQRDRVDAQPVLIAPERARPASEAAQPVPSPQTNRRRDHRWWLGGSRRHHRARLHAAGAGGGDGRGHGRRAADGEPRASDPPIVLCLSPASQLPPTCLHPGWSASHPLSTTP